MELRVLNSLFIAEGTLDSHSVDSVIWVERFNSEGTFEIYAKYSAGLMDLLRLDRYIIGNHSERAMVIEDVVIKTDPEGGDKIIASGRSLESILDRRIILRQIQVDTTLQAGIQAILNAEVINGLYPERNFPNFVFSWNADPTLATINLTAQYYSQNLLKTINDLCYQSGIGYKVILNNSNQLVFSLYLGSDRSYDQTVNPYVVFSPSFDNLIKSESITSTKYKKNYALVSGDPTGLTGLPVRAQVWLPDVGTGLNRREMFVDASDISRYDDDTTLPIDSGDYLAQLSQRGWEELARNSTIRSFDGQVDMSRTYKYGVDFGLGDAIQMVDLYGNATKAIVLEMTFSEDLASGFTVYPTLETI